MRHRSREKTRSTGSAAASVTTSAAGKAAVHRPGNAPVAQRINKWYQDGPKATDKQNPLHIIAGAVQSATGVSAGNLFADWSKGSSLKLAKTAKPPVVSMATYTRPDNASAWLDTPNSQPGGRGTDPPWIRAVGNLGSVEDQIKGHNINPYNGGHLIAWEFLNAEANIPGNVAPQAAVQNMALFRRIERSVEEAAKHGKGLEVTVNTPYNSDNYAVTFEELIQRGIIAEPGVIEAINTKGVQKTSVTLPQVAPDTYDVYYLTQSDPLALASKDAREDRNGIETQKLWTYQGGEVTKLQKGQLKPLTILASNFNEATNQQEAAAFAHIVFTNYRSNPAADVDMGIQKKEDAQPKITELDLQKANQILHFYPQQVYVLSRYLEDEFDMGPTEAHKALLYILLTGA